MIPFNPVLNLIENTKIFFSDFPINFFFLKGSLIGQNNHRLNDIRLIVLFQCINCLQKNFQLQFVVCVQEKNKIQNLIHFKYKTNQVINLVVFEYLLIKQSLSKIVNKKWMQIRLDLNFCLRSLNLGKILIYFPNFMFFYNQQINNQMTERRAWTQEQDKVLKYLKDTVQVKKWSQIAKKLEFEYNLPGRNGKQCRQRYTNHLDSSIISNEFTLQEEQKLFKLHDKIGNKWSHICKQFHGRTDNHIKNHFHSKLRKGIRKLNKQIKLSFKKTVRPYKLNIIYKIVESSDYRFSEKLSFPQEYLNFFNGLKNTILQYAGGIVQKTQLSQMREKQQAQKLISQLQSFQKIIKNKTFNSSLSRTSKNTNINFTKKSARKNSTSESECLSQELQSQMNDENDQSSMIYQDASIQFIDQKNGIIPSYKSMEDDTTNSNQAQKQNQLEIEIEDAQNDSKDFYSFQKNKKQFLKQTLDKQNILHSLIQEIDFQGFMNNRKLSIKSFESLRQFEDSCLNDSQVNMLLKRFDSFSNLQAGLFE